MSDTTIDVDGINPDFTSLVNGSKPDSSLVEDDIDPEFNTGPDNDIDNCEPGSGFGLDIKNSDSSVDVDTNSCLRNVADIVDLNSGIDVDDSRPE